VGQDVDELDAWSRGWRGVGCRLLGVVLVDDGGELLVGVPLTAAVRVSGRGEGLVVALLEGIGRRVDELAGLAQLARLGDESLGAFFELALLSCLAFGRASEPGCCTRVWRRGSGASRRRSG
jgi:hypothetical protein